MSLSREKRGRSRVSPPDRPIPRSGCGMRARSSRLRAFSMRAPYLQSWLEEHLAFQRDDGSLEDWIDSRGKADKNTTETDQETSAVRAAARITRISSAPAWLEKRIEGETILSRLERALRFVLDSSVRQSPRARHRRAHRGLGRCGYGRARTSGPSMSTHETHWTCDIYDQSRILRRRPGSRPGCWTPGGQTDEGEVLGRTGRAHPEKRRPMALAGRSEDFTGSIIHLDALAARFRRGRDVRHGRKRGGHHFRSGL